MPEIPSTEPAIVRAGQTIQWTKSLSDYPATEYVLKYYLSGPALIDLSASAYNTTDHLISVSAATSAGWGYGLYEWTAYAEKGSGPTLEKYFLWSGKLLVKTAEGKSFARTMLDQIEAILEGRATSKTLDQVQKNLGSNSISKDPELLMKARAQFRNEYQTELAWEQTVQGGASGSRVLMRFRKAT